MGISSKDIFCSSFDEQGIPPGKDFAPYMRERIGEAEIVLAVVSPQYYESPFCLCETGGAWATKTEFIPLLVEPVRYDDLRGALYGRQGLLISSSEKLDAMRDALASLGDSKTTRWNRKKEDFLAALPGLLKALKPIETLKGAPLKKLTDALASAKKEAADLDTLNEQLQEKIKDLEAAKDAKAVAAIRKKHSSENDQFEELIDTLRDALQELPRIAREALRYYVRKDYFSPKPEEWGDEVEDAVHRDYLREDDNHVALNDDHPAVEVALSAWHALSDFSEEVGEGFVKDYRKEHKDVFNITSLPFWEKHDLQ